ncbi:hypothetical protein KKF61_07245 [Patescibacteria group bacterium]|nr:hypothetical protein [Patescibacteria group bacterium]
MKNLSKSQAIKKFFGEGKNSREVTNPELRELIAADRAGYDWLAEECLKALEVK